MMESVCHRLDLLVCFELPIVIPRQMVIDFIVLKVDYRVSATDVRTILRTKFILRKLDSYKTENVDNRRRKKKRWT